MSNKFMIFRTQDGFKSKLRENVIPNDSIVFIKETSSIWTHGHEFGKVTGFEKAKGYFDTEDELKKYYPTPEVGDWAIIGSAIVDDEEKQWVVARCTIKGRWGLTAQTYDRETFDVNLYVRKDELDSRDYVTKSYIMNYLAGNYATKDYVSNYVQQHINNNGTVIVDSELSTESTNPVQNKVITTALANKLEESDIEDRYVKTEDISDLIGADIDGIWTAIRERAYTSDVNNILSRLEVYDQVTLPNKVDRSELNDYARKDEIETEVNTYVTQIVKVAEKAKGYYDSYADLVQAVPSPEVGDWAVISSNGVWVVCKCSTDGVWTQTSQQYVEDAPDLNGYAKTTDLDNYTLQSDFNQHVAAFNQHVTAANNLYATKSELTTGLNTNRQYTDDELDDAKTELQAQINAITVQLNRVIDTYISWYGTQEGGQGGSSHLPANSSNMVTLSEEEYQALVDADEVDLNTYYFTYNAADYPEHTTWTFGGTFPITFTEQWAFGGTFPINLQ